MVLYVIGLGLGDEKDITVRGLECAKKCTRLYLEFYTSVLGIDTAKLEAFYGVPVVLADRNMVCSLRFTSCHLPPFTLPIHSFEILEGGVRS